MKKEMMKRCKGWLALVLCFGMMFGSSLTVFAAYTDDVLGISDGTEVNENDVLKSGDKIGYTLTKKSGSLTVIYELTSQLKRQGTNSNNSGLHEHTIETIDGVSTWKVQKIWFDGSNTEISLIPYVETSDAIIEPKTKRTQNADHHDHNFEWFMTKEPTKTEDGESSYICHSCGYVAATQPVTRWQWFMKQYRGLIKDAAQNATITFEADDMPCISDYMLSLNADRPDVTVIVHFTYEGVIYELTIPAGTDFSAVQNDTDTFYGYLGLAAKLGLTATVLS